MLITYHSTNGSDSGVRFKDVLFRGHALDGGLYVPDRIPVFGAEELRDLSSMKYHEIAATVMGKYLIGDIPQYVLQKMCEDAYKFDTPLERVNGKTHIMRLDLGPTASFKDYAALMLARFMSYYAQEIGKEIIVLVSTSGDTGSAIANAFYGIGGVRVIVQYPSDEVTQRQARMMDSLVGNITALAGGRGITFDDLQKNCDKAFSDEELKNYLDSKGVMLTSANSINWARLMPQMVYYFYATAVLGNDVVFSVPCGNFGNVTAGLYSKFMGNPVSKFVIATNENDEFPNFMRTGDYVPLNPSINCISNAMNVGDPSNLRRLFGLYGGKLVKGVGIEKMPDINAMRRDIFTVSIKQTL